MVIQRVYRRAIIFVRAGRPQSELGEIGFADDRDIGPPSRSPERRVSSRRGEFLARYCDPAVVTSPFMSMMSLTARRSFPASPELANRR